MAKKKKGKAHPNNVYKSYKVDGDSLSRLRKSCPKCGQGVFLAQHKGRLTCGKCGYTEFSGKDDAKEGKPEGKPKQEPKAEEKEKPVEKQEKPKAEEKKV